MKEKSPASLAQQVPTLDPADAVQWAGEIQNEKQREEILSGLAKW